MKNRNPKLIFTGDVLPADREHTLGIGVGTKIDGRITLWSDQVKKLLRQGDITVINLEGPIVALSDIKQKKAFAGCPKILDNFSEAGITHAHVANNHILEHGPHSFNKTMSMLKAAGVEIIGNTMDGVPAIVLTEKNDLKIALAGFNSIHDLTNPGCYAELNEKVIIETLRRPEMQNADVRLLIFHWGNEYIHVPSWEQIQIAHLAINEGAHLVVGHHPHVIQPVEKYKNGLICYSLGNFLFDMIWNRAVRTGAILEVDVAAGGVVSWHIHTTRYDRSYNVALLQPGWIEKRLMRWKMRMDAMQAKGESYYKKNYKKQVARQRMFARMQMKKQLLLQLHMIPHVYRKRIMQSLIRKVSSLIGG